MTKKEVATMNKLESILIDFADFCTRNEIYGGNKSRYKIKLDTTKLAILEVVRGTIPKRDSRNTQECKMIDSINSKIGGL